MNRKIRYGCFETNSSSEHAICISHYKFDTDDIEPQTINFDHQTFPRKTQAYEKFQDKVNYLYQAIWDVYSNKYYGNDKKFQFVYTKACNHIYEVLGKYNVDCTFTENHKDEDGFERGEIDHGGELCGWVDLVLSNEKYLLKYLFGDSVVVTGSDEGIGGDFEKELDKYVCERDVWYRYCG